MAAARARCDNAVRRAILPEGRPPRGNMKIITDLMIFFGAVILVTGSDLVIETAGQDLSSVGGLLGTLLSIVGVSLLAAGILSQRSRAPGARAEDGGEPR